MCIRDRQSIVNFKGEFIDCYAGWPGSVHDARVYANSPIGIQIEDSPMDVFSGDSFIIGDAAYPLSTRCIPPFKDMGNLSDVQKNFNFKHASARNVVERTFGIMKSRFRRLTFIDSNNCDLICRIIMSGCLLHNFSYKFPDEHEEEIDFQIEVDPNQCHRNSLILLGGSKKDAEARRQKIVDSL